MLGLALFTVLLLTLLDWGVLPRALAFELGGGWRGKEAKTLALGEVVVEVGSELVGGGRSVSRSMVAAGAECEALCREAGSEREARSDLVGAWNSQNAKIRRVKRVAFLGTVEHKHNDVDGKGSCLKSGRSRELEFTRQNKLTHRLSRNQQQSSQLRRRLWHGRTGQSPIGRAKRKVGLTRRCLGGERRGSGWARCCCGSV